MRLVLEKADLIKILEKHLSVKLAPDMVLVRTEPSFEVEVSGIPLTDEALTPEAPKARSAPQDLVREERLPGGWIVTPPNPVAEPLPRRLGPNTSYDLPRDEEYTGTVKPPDMSATNALLSKLGSEE